MVQSQSFVLISMVIISMVSAGPCPDDSWRYSPHSNKCYKLFNEKTGWNLGEFRCAFKGGHHLSIHDQIENQFVSELAKQADLVWLGIAQFGTSQSYVWSDTTSFDYENWHAKHNYRKPIYNKGRKCAKLEGHTGTWMQSCCKIPAAYICERPGTEVTTTPTPTTVPTTPWWLNPTNIADSNTNELRRFRFRRL